MADLRIKIHHKCRNGAYPREPNVVRTEVPDDKVSWDVNWPNYKPVYFSHAKLEKAEYADPDIMTQKSTIAFNKIDGKIDRRSFYGEYKIDDKGVPLNIVGRTGVNGRGCLGRWGPNHAADPIVTRWKRDEKGEKILNEKTKRFILQFASIQRRSSGEWAIPGVSAKFGIAMHVHQGMVDAGEAVTSTLKREFGEEALDSHNMTAEEKAAAQAMLHEAFSNGIEIYKGYVDDPRNTDNSWMETVAYNFHDETGKGLGAISLTAGDDAQAVRWADLDHEMKLYASHSAMLEMVAHKHAAHW